MQEIEGFIEQSQLAQNVGQLQSLFAFAMGECGFENFVLVSCNCKKEQAAIHVDHLPDGFVGHYFDQGWLSVDPVVDEVLSSRQPFCWSQMMVKRGVSKAQLNFMNGAAELGVHNGISIPFHGPDERIYNVAFSQRTPKEVSLRTQRTAVALGVQFFFRFLELVPPIEHIAAPVTMLTRRETECLGWCRDGKTSWEISVILSISEKTVQFHISNAILKLRAPNRMAAVIKALRLGILDL